MSSTSRGNQVENDDFFATPSWVVKAILPYLPVTAGTPVLDPCCGEGAILDTVRAVYPTAKTLGLELDAYRANVAKMKGHDVEVGNALLNPWWPRVNDPAVVIQNPPFSRAQDFVQRGIDYSFGQLPPEDSPLIRRAIEGKRASAVLLRLAFLESAERIVAFHRQYPADVYPLAYRPSFAMVVSCAADGKKGCGWRVILPLDAERPSECGLCKRKVRVNTSDSCAYAWFVWGPGRGGRIKVLDDAPPNARAPKPAKTEDA